MNKYVALLRGINVGGNNKIDMKTLKEAFEKSGFENVLTYINSGNVIFETKEKSAEKIVNSIEELIESTFGFHIQVVVRTKENIEEICTTIPNTWTEDKQNRTYVMFLWDEVDNKKSIELLSLNPNVDSAKYIEGAIIWHLQKKDLAKSGMKDIMKNKLYKQMTIRNINTVRKLETLLNN